MVFTIQKNMMEFDLNSSTLIGTLGGDPKSTVLKKDEETGRDRIAVSLTVVTEEMWENKTTGQTTKQVEWHRINITNQGFAGYAMRNLKKGSKVHLTGRIRTRSYTTDNSTEKKYTTEICIENGQAGHRITNLSGPKNKNESSQSGSEQNEQSGNAAHNSGQTSTTQRNTNPTPAPTPTPSPTPAPTPSSNSSTGHNNDGWNPNGDDLDDEIPF